MRSNAFGVPASDADSPCLNSEHTVSCKGPPKICVCRMPVVHFSHGMTDERTYELSVTAQYNEEARAGRACHYPRNSSPAAGLPGSSEVLKLAVKQVKIRSHAGSSGMSQSFSLAFRLDKRAGDGHIDAICLISKRIHLHDKRAEVSMSWVMTRREGPGSSCLTSSCRPQRHHSQSPAACR